MRTSISFSSSGTTCAADYYIAPVEGPRPCVVMAHGFGGTKDSGLEAFATPFIGAGVDVLAFDYRHFGDSGGSPRQVVSAPRQRADYRAAVEAARRQPGVDPERVILWGTSYSGAHVLRIAAEEVGIAAVIALAPAVADLRGLHHFISQGGAVRAARASTRALLRGTVRSLRGGPPTLLPLVGSTDSESVLATPGAYDGYLRMAGPTWRNEVAARSLLTAVRCGPGKLPPLSCPALLQITDEDRLVSPDAGARLAAMIRAEVRHLPCDHFDVEPGGNWQSTAVDHQLQFLRRHGLAQALPHRLERESV